MVAWQHREDGGRAELIEVYRLRKRYVAPVPWWRSGPCGLASRSSLSPTGAAGSGSRRRGHYWAVALVLTLSRLDAELRFIRALD